jgi:GxxExxY protein
MSTPMDIDVTTGHIVDAAVKLHIRLGPGLLESVYRTLLARDLSRRGLEVETEKLVGFNFDGMYFEKALRLDLLVNRQVIVEVKSIEELAPIHSKQLLTYLRALDLPVGLLLNFGGMTLREGLKRVVNNYNPAPSSVAVSATTA